jgi:hypothetical protein
MTPDRPKSPIAPAVLPGEIGISRSNLEALILAWMKSKYKLDPDKYEVTFNWKSFEFEVMVTTKRK